MAFLFGEAMNLSKGVLFEILNKMFSKSQLSSIFLSGPDSPIPLAEHGMVNFGTDLVVMGGRSNGSFSSAFYQLSAENGKLKWEKMKHELKKPRSDFVAMTIPDHLVDYSS